MIKVKYLSILVILTMMLGLLAACGDSPTATAVPPTATAVPPTETPAPPPPTATTAAPEAAPTNTTGTSGSGSSGPAANADQIALIQQAVTATQELKSYHFTMMASGDIITQPVQLEGDFVAPDKLYVKGTAEGKDIEEVVSGGKAYTKGADGKWAEVQPTPEATPSGLGGLGGGLGNMVPGLDPADLVQEPNVVKSMAPFLSSVGGISDTQQDETINGVSTKHFTFKLDAESMMRDSGGIGQLPPNMQDVNFGSGGFWIDPQTKFVHKIDMTLDIGGLLKFMFDAMAAAFGGTPTPGGEEPTPTPPLNIHITMTISKHNDTSITIPTVP